MPYSQTITPILPTGMNTVGASSCTISPPQQSTCILEINSGTASLGTQNISFISTSGTPPAPESITIFNYWTSITGESGQPTMSTDQFSSFYATTTPNSVLINDGEANSNIWYYTNESWTQLSGESGQPSPTIGLSYGVHPQGIITPNSFLAQDGNDAIWTYINGVWQEVPGQPSNICYGLYPNVTPTNIYVNAGPNNTSYQMWEYDNNTNWLQLTGTGGTSPATISTYCTEFGSPSPTSLVQINQANNIFTSITNGASWTDISDTSAYPGAPTNTIRIRIYGTYPSQTSIVMSPDGGAATDLYTFNGTSWAHLIPGGAGAPTSVGGAAGINPTPTSFILFDNASPQQLWYYNNGNWQQLTGLNDQPPGLSTTAQSPISNDATIDNIFISDSSTPSQLWHYNGSSWTKLTGGDNQPPSSGFDASYNSTTLTTTSLLITDANYNLWSYNNGIWTQITDGSTHGGTQPANAYIIPLQDTTSTSFVFSDANTTPYPTVSNVWIAQKYH